MVRNKRRRRQLARAKWERQATRRQIDARRRRRIGLVVSVIVGLILAAALVWLILYIVDKEKADETPPVPTDSFSTQLLTPSSNLPPPSDQPTGQPTDQPEQTGPSPRPSTATETTGANPNSTESSP